MDLGYASLIEAWEDLPREGLSLMQERYWFDVKLTYAPGTHGEKAKDVAAFANAAGGTVIVGASEGPTGPRYDRPLPIDFASRIEGEFDEAVRDYCRPSPTVHVRTIPVPGQPANVILAVNVEPLVDQPVAVRHASDTTAWRFPQRIGRHTEFILPEQLPLFMNSKARRAKLLLLRACQDGGLVDLFTVPSAVAPRGSIQAPTLVRVSEVDTDESGAFSVRDETGDLQGQTVVVPLDDVEAVWKQESGRWAARLSGGLDLFLFDSAEGSELAYIPPGTSVSSPLARTVEDLSKRVVDLGRILKGTLIVEHHQRPELTHDLIAARAYQIWLMRTRMGTPGTSEGDWLKARQILLRERRD